MSRGIRLYAYCIDLYVPFASLKRSKVDIEPFRELRDRTLQMRATAPNDLGSNLAHVLASRPVTDRCLQALRLWRFYRRADAPIISVEFSIPFRPEDGDVIMTFGLLGTEDVVDSRHMAKTVYTDAVRSKLHPRMSEALVPRDWIRADTDWIWAKQRWMTGYIIGEDGEWTLDSESPVLDY